MEEKNEVEPVLAPEEGEVELRRLQEEEAIETPSEETLEKTQKEVEPSLTKEQKSKLESFDRIYAENKKLKQARAGKDFEGSEVEEWSASGDPLEVVKLGKALKDYSDEETEFIIRNAPSKDINGIVKAEKDPWVQSAIQATREKVAKENKVPEPSSPASEADFSDAEEVVRKGREAVIAEAQRRAAELARRGRGEGL